MKRSDKTARGLGLLFDSFVAAYSLLVRAVAEGVAATEVNQAEVTLVDVFLPTRSRLTIRKRCISRPTEHQAILLQRLGLELPSSLEMA